MEDCDYMFKYIIIGDTCKIQFQHNSNNYFIVAVGKSCVSLRFTNNVFR